ncbi:hypothetical protein HDU67_001686 [Dinochytrium kinnereticum]|nr:hypothetical protein HDU67_001686 [Dinochytrium kinnereticum]
MTIIQRTAATASEPAFDIVSKESEGQPALPPLPTSQSFGGVSPSPATGKQKEDFRNYKDSAEQARVEQFYHTQHRLQTLATVQALEARHLKFNKFKLGCWETLEYLDRVVDDSDPDTSLTQVQHALQSAEAARRAYPSLDWMHLVTLIHDLGKVLAVTDEGVGIVGEPHVGCRFEDTNIFHHAFRENPDSTHPVYSTRLGIYKENCGIDQLKMSWGHDEYLYQVLIHNNAQIPAAGLAMIRYHSFYPWHSAGGYRHFCKNDPTPPVQGQSPRTENIGDDEKLKWVKMFNEFDLYSKADGLCNVEALKPYYVGLIEKYLPGVLEW